MPHPIFKLSPLALLLLPLFGQAQTSPAADERVLTAISVTAKKSQSQEIRRNASAGKIVVDREELEALDASSMGELLSKLPGGGLFADLGGGPRGRKRGPDRNMPMILVDGQPLPGGGRNPMAALRLPVELIERVEIIRNSTAEFPVTSPGGVINLILRDVPSQLVRSAKVGVGFTDGRPGWRLDGQYGAPEGSNFGYLLSGSVDSRPQVGSETMAATTYTNGVPSGTVRERATQSGRDNNLVFSPRFSWNLGDGQRLTVSPFLIHNEAESTSTIDRDNSGVAEQDRLVQAGRRTSGRLSTEWKKLTAGGTETTARLMLQAERDDATRSTRKFDGTATTREREATLREERGAMLELRRKQLLADAHLITGALEWRNQSTDDRQTRVGGTAPSTSAMLAAQRFTAWAQDEWQMSERQVLTPGLRYQSTDSRVDDSTAGVIEHANESLDPSLHYLWQVSEAWNLRASIAQTTKLPFTRDLSPSLRQTNGTNSSGNPDRGGNPNLEPERLRSIELGVEHFLDDRAGTIGFSVFDREIENYIQRLIDDEGGRWVERPRNVGKARLRGALLDFKSKLMPALTLRGNLAYTHTRMLEQLPGLGGGDGPRQSANLGLDYEVPAYRFTVGGNYNYTSAMDRESSATLTQYQGVRRQLDLYALYKFDKQTALRLSAQNVTREARTNHLREVDANGLVSRIEDERTPGQASYFATLELKW